MSDDFRKQLVAALGYFAVAIVGALTTMVGNCSAGIATKGDVANATATIQRALNNGLASCVQRDEYRHDMGDPPAPREKRAPVFDRLDTIEQSNAALASEQALEVMRSAAFDIAFWRQLQTRAQRDTWVDARDGALGRWDYYALGRAPSKAAESMLREAKVPR